MKKMKQLLALFLTMLVMVSSTGITALADGSVIEETTEEAGSGSGRKWQQTIKFHSNYPDGTDDVVIVHYNVNSYISSSTSLYNGSVRTFSKCSFKVPVGYQLKNNYWNTKPDGTGKMQIGNSFAFYYSDRGTTTDLFAQYMEDSSHVHSYMVATSPDCIHDGLKRCACGKEQAIRALGHDLFDVPWRDGSGHTDECQTTGHMHVCRRCGGWLEGGQESEPHEYGEWETIKQATETEEGRKERHCTKCEHMESEPIPVSPHVHVFVTDEARLPDCIHEGLTEGRHCSSCGYAEIPQETVPALGHSFEDVPWTDGDGHAPGCASIEHVMTCIRCHGDLEGGRLYEAHAYGEWEIVKEPTETEDGLKERHCLICEHMESESIPKAAEQEPDIPDGPTDGVDEQEPDIPDGPTGGTEPEEPVTPDEPEEPVTPDKPVDESEELTTSDESVDEPQKPVDRPEGSTIPDDEILMTEEPNLEILPNDRTPLADVPQTNDSIFWFLPMLASGLSLIKRRKRR